MTSCHGFKNIENIYFICLYFDFLQINYDLSHVHCLSMYGFSEPGLVDILFQSNSHFVHMAISI